MLSVSSTERGFWNNPASGWHAWAWNLTVVVPTQRGRLMCSFLRTPLRLQPPEEREPNPNAGVVDGDSWLPTPSPRPIRAVPLDLTRNQTGWGLRVGVKVSWGLPVDME